MQDYLEDDGGEIFLMRYKICISGERQGRKIWVNFLKFAKNLSIIKKIFENASFHKIFIFHSIFEANMMLIQNCAGMMVGKEVRMWTN